MSATVHFVGAGPGAADLLTVRGVRLLESADVVLFPGTYLDPDAQIGAADPGHRIGAAERGAGGFGRLRVGLAADLRHLAGRLCRAGRRGAEVDAERGGGNPACIAVITGGAALLAMPQHDGLLVGDQGLQPAVSPAHRLPGAAQVDCAQPERGGVHAAAERGGAQGDRGHVQVRGEVGHRRRHRRPGRLGGRSLPPRQPDARLGDGQHGTAHGVSEEGALLVHTASGMRAITSAEISVRPTA